MASIERVQHPEAGVCLALVRSGIQHGYPIAQEFSSDGDVGAVLTATRPAVYRELAALESRGLLSSREDRGARGQAKKILKITAAGNKALDAWLSEPVHHIRDIRTEFLVKYMMRDRLQMSNDSFVRAQRDILREVTEALGSTAESSVITVWRREQARAVIRFLDEIEGQSAAEPMLHADDGIVLSARNQLRGSVVSVQHGDILSSVKLAIDNGQTMTSTVTREAARALRLTPGSPVTALCKATDVLLGVHGLNAPN